MCNLRVDSGREFHPVPTLPEAVKKFSLGKMVELNNVRGRRKFGCQNEGLISSLTERGLPMLSRKEIKEALGRWNQAWDRHDLDGVMDLFHEGVYFENWTGGKVQGKEPLRQAWKPWFENHGGFRFTGEDLFIDEAEQKVLYQWRLDWPSDEKGYEGRKERRRGLDVIHFRDGRIIYKSSYSKTTLEIEGKRVKLLAAKI